MSDGLKEHREFVNSLPYMGDSTPLIREDGSTATIDPLTSRTGASRISA
jgi:hypothetical protein